jgi:TolB-like protein
LAGKKDMTFKKMIAYLAMVALMGLNGPALWAEEPSKVVIVPFGIHSEKDLSFLQEGIVDMLTTRLSWENKVVVMPRKATEEALKSIPQPLNEKTARGLGASLGADYVLFGSLTIFGESVSIDAKMIDVQGLKPAVTAFNQSQGMDAVIPKVNAFAADINQRVFGRATARPVTAPTPAPAAQTQPVPSIYAHPEKLLGQPGVDQGAGGEVPSALNPAFVVTQGARDAATYWKSRNFDFYIKSMAIGDVNGDGNQEIVLISQSAIFIYRKIQGRLLKVDEIEGSAKNHHITVEVADVNQNGIAEIFVNDMNTTRDTLTSFVLEWDGTGFVPILENQSWYYRVLDLPARGPVLMGQRRGIRQAFLPGIHELTWQGDRYESASKLRVPRELNVFSFTVGDIMNSNNEAILTFDEFDHLRVLGESGSKEWKSEEKYGGSLNYVDTFDDDYSSEKDEDKNRIYLGQRIFLRDLDRDGKLEVLVAKNEGPTSRIFKRLRHYSSCEIVNLSWDGIGLGENWKTRKIQSYVSDFAVADFDNDGEDEMVAIVVMKKGASLLLKAKSAIISYDLANPETAANES